MASRRRSAAGLVVATVAFLLLIGLGTTAPAIAASVAGPTTPSGLSAGSGTMPMPSVGAPWEWEPQVAIDGAGGLWAVGGHCPFIDQYGPCGAPTVGPGRADILAVWHSIDGGRSWTFVADPLALPSFLGGVSDSIGSSDPDVAVAPESRPGRPPILATVSLYGASTTIAVSADAGRTWSVVPGTGVPAQDRPWLAASGTCDLYLEYDPLADLAGAATVPRVERYDACAISSQPGVVTATPQTSTPVEPLANAVTNGDQLPGRLATGGGGVFASYLACDATSACTLGIGVSRDRGATWSDVTPPAPTATVLNDQTFPIAAGADASGAVAVAVTDHAHVYVWASRDNAATWPVARRPVDAALGWSLANVPSVAIRGPHVAVAWFGSPPVAGPQPWYLVIARSDDAGVTWRDTVFAPVLATTGHGAPLGAALYDDFGTAVTPSGDDVAVYTASCQGHAVADPACPGPPGPGTYDMTRFAWVSTASAGAPVASPAPSGRPAAPTGSPAWRATGAPALPATGRSAGDAWWAAAGLLGTAVLAKRLGARARGRGVP